MVGALAIADALSAAGSTHFQSAFARPAQGREVRLWILRAVVAPWLTMPTARLASYEHPNNGGSETTSIGGDTWHVPKQTLISQQEAGGTAGSLKLPRRCKSRKR